MNTTKEHGGEGVFFFQAEDGIRDVAVTGVQTCALPISIAWPGTAALRRSGPEPLFGAFPGAERAWKLVINPSRERSLAPPAADINRSRYNSILASMTTIAQPNSADLEWAHPLVRDWFVGRFGTPTEPQLQGWPHILAGKTALISAPTGSGKRSEEHTSELQSRLHLVCRLLLEK